MRITILLIALLPIPHFAFAGCIPNTKGDTRRLTQKLINQGDLYLTGGFTKNSLACYNEALESRPNISTRAKILLKIFDVLELLRSTMVGKGHTEESLTTDRAYRMQRNLLKTSKIVESMKELSKEASLDRKEASLDRKLKNKLGEAIDIFTKQFRELTIITNGGTSYKLHRRRLVTRLKRLALNSVKHLNRKGKSPTTIVVPIGKYRLDTNTRGSFEISLQKRDEDQRCSIKQFSTNRSITQKTTNCVLDLTRIQPLFLAPKIPLPESRFPWAEVGITAGGVAIIAIGIFMYKNAQDPVEQNRAFLQFD
ncbi:MAG: hypothetical protein CL685_01870 [Candidatus Magasanikbacteria bacterium]|nr:hypothetical protein [Candidatus Magasanikbacteria bacterium]